VLHVSGFCGIGKAVCDSGLLKCPIRQKMRPVGLSNVVAGKLRRLVPDFLSFVRSRLIAISVQREAASGPHLT
jgi:hypothetical protein